LSSGKQISAVSGHRDGDRLYPDSGESDGGIGCSDRPWLASNTQNIIRTS